MAFEEKNMKRGRKKGENVQEMEKREKRENGKQKRVKINEKN
jgi:hypothetical protein